MLPPFSLPCPRAGEIDRLTSQSQACQPGGDAPRWGFLSAARKEPKTTKGGAFPRLVESTPRYWVERAPFSSRPWTGPCHIDGFPFYGFQLLLCLCILLPPGPYLGKPLFPAVGSLASGGGNAAWPG